MADDLLTFEQLFRRLHAPLCEVVDVYVRSQDTAEEIVQDLFLAVWIKRETVTRADSLTAYLFAAARNRAVMHIRHRAVVQRKVAQLGREPELSPQSAQAPAADRQLEQRETAHAVRAAIDALPPRTRLAIVLRIDHGMSVAEIATAMGISLKGAEKLLGAAKGKLRSHLGEVDTRSR